MLGSGVCKCWYSDGAPELHAARRDLGLAHDKATPDRHETNGVIERANGTFIEGTAVVLYQSGLPHKFWPDAMRAFCQMHNVHHEVDGSKIPWLLRKGKRFEGTRMPFGSKVYYRPSAPAELQKQQKSGDKLREGLFFGYALANCDFFFGRRTGC